MNRLYFFLIIISLFFIHSCDSGLTAEYISIEKFRDLKGRVVSDSVFYLKENRDNGQLNLEVKFNVFLLDDNIDSIQLNFPGGTPEKIVQELKPTISYDSYGPKSVNLILSQIDTTYYNEIISYKNVIYYDDYLNIVYLSGTEELLIICGTIIGAGIGFLWFNTYPAQIFMGDVGSLSLGAALGGMAVILRQEVILAIMGGVFVIEALSVIIQVTSFKLTGKRVFKMSPIHHHFELSGWAEPKIIVRFWIITLILVLIALATFRLR